MHSFGIKSIEDKDFCLKMLAVIIVFCFYWIRISLLLFRWRCSFLKVRTDRCIIKTRCCCCWNVVDLLGIFELVVLLIIIICVPH